jgi:hypothetical protein
MFLLDNLPGYAQRKPHNPETASSLGLGWPPFARRYWGGLFLISFPEGTEMFHFPSLASHDYEFIVR